MLTHQALYFWSHKSDKLKKDSNLDLFAYSNYIM